MKFADVVKKKMLKEHIDYDDPNLQKAYSHDRMGYVIASEYIEALESMGYSKEEIYVIYGSTYTRHQLDKLFDNILPAIKKFWISQTKLSKSNYDKMLKENMKKQFNLISIVKKVMRENTEINKLIKFLDYPWQEDIEIEFVSLLDQNRGNFKTSNWINTLQYLRGMDKYNPSLSMAASDKFLGMWDDLIK